MKDSIKGVKTYEERLKKIEGKIEGLNEKVENNSRTAKENLTSTKDMLMSKFEIIRDLEEQITTLKEDQKYQKDLNTNFHARFGDQLVVQDKNTTVLQCKLEDYIKDTNEKMQIIKSQVDSQTLDIRKFHKRIEMFNQNITSQFEKQNIDIDLRVRQNDMMQNFQKLNDLMTVKFKQVDDVKQACR